MKQHEIERMISLVDDKYIDEAFEQKIQVKKRFPLLLPIAAAAAVCGLIFAARLPSSELTDMVASEAVSVTEIAETDEYNENLRYWKYFDGDKTEAITRPDRELYYRVYLSDEYIKEILNIDPSYTPIGSTLNFDRNDAVTFFDTTIYMSSSGVFSSVYLSVYPIYTEQPVLPPNGTPETINGVEVYGFEHRSDTLHADFIIGNYGYSLMFFNAGYKQAYEITEMLIGRRLTIEELDRTEYVDGTGIPHGDAIMKEPFRKFVPREEEFGDMSLSRTGLFGMIAYAETLYNNEPVQKHMYLLYADDPTVNGKKHIKLYYKWYSYEVDYCSAEDEPVYIFDLVRSMMKHFAAEEKAADEMNSFELVVDCGGGCVIDVSAVCTENELWECLTSIMREATKQTSSSYMLVLDNPVDGEISAPYGYITNRFHKGIDFRADEGTPVYAAADGTVIQPVDADTGDGKNVIINHYTDTNTFYAHLSEVVVNEGDKVRRGDLIGYIGSTGSSTGPHLHFELCIDGIYVDPIDFFGQSTDADSSPTQIHFPNQQAEN